MALFHNVYDRLIVFTRYPEPGKTKTRLIPGLGSVGAADVQRKLTQDVLRTASRAARRLGMGVEVCFEGGDKRRMRRWLGGGFQYREQGRGDLGERMRAAFHDAFCGGARHVVLIGSDVPHAGSGHLEKAFRFLDDHDLVLGPVTDGGYWLVGMNAFHEVFEGVPWSTSVVLNSTLKKAEALGLKVGLLESIQDIDTPEDLHAWDAREAFPGPYVSVIVPTLNEASHIEAAVANALNEDAEVIVVDGGSSDRTAAKATAAGALVRTASCGRWIQQNSGAAAARGRVLLFLHADTLLPEGYPGHVFEALMDPRVVGGAFRFKTNGTTRLMRVVEFMTNLRANCLKLPYGDQALFVRASVFDAIGGFCASPIAEDLFFVRSLARTGRIRIVPAAAVTSWRRWRKLGVVRTTLVNQLVLAGCLAGVSPRVLADLYRGRKTAP